MTLWRRRFRAGWWCARRRFRPGCRSRVAIRLKRIRSQTVRVTANRAAATAATLTQIAPAPVTASTAARVVGVGAGTCAPGVVDPDLNGVASVGCRWRLDRAGVFGAAGRPSGLHGDRAGSHDLLGGRDVGDRRGHGVASVDLLGVEPGGGTSWTAVPTAAAIGTASSDTATASTNTSAWIRSVVRTSGLRPNSRSRTATAAGAR